MSFEHPELIHGLAVWESKSGYWNPEYGSVGQHPEDWVFVPVGDAGLTRRVRKGAHWILRQKNETGRSPIIGTLAPSDSVAQATAEVGGEKGLVERKQQKLQKRETREQELTAAISMEVRRQYPLIPHQDVEAILLRCRQPGHVGKAQELYFGTTEERKAAMTEIAHRAVVAHVRHNHTGYDVVLERKLNRLQLDYGFVDYEMRQEARWQARNSVAPKICRILESWQSPALVETTNN